MKQDKIIQCYDIHKVAHPVTPDKLVWRPAVRAIVIENGQILLSPQYDGYDLPGGGIELGETIEEALIREVHEETGLTVEVGEHILTNDSFYYGLRGDCFQGILIYHLCKVTGGELTTEFFDNHEHSYMKAAEWVDLEQAKTAKYMGSQNTALAIEIALKRIGK